MKTGDILEKLAKEYPLSMALSWDNSGLQVGRSDRETDRIFVALDATEDVVEQCIKSGAQLLLTHHPLLMSGIRRISENDMYGRKILSMIENGITHYAMHTNYDVVLMTELAQKAMQMKDTSVLEVTGVHEDGQAYGIGCVGDLPQKMTARECCGFVKNAFGLENVRLFGNPERKIFKAALSPGSGKSMINSALKAEADILITGDIGHHDGLDAVDQGLLVMDAGHYGLEHIFIAQMKQYLMENFPDVQVECAEIKAPFQVF